MDEDNISNDATDAAVNDVKDGDAEDGSMDMDTAENDDQVSTDPAVVQDQISDIQSDMERLAAEFKAILAGQTDPAASTADDQHSESGMDASNKRQLTMMHRHQQTTPTWKKISILMKACLQIS